MKTMKTSTLVATTVCVALSMAVAGAAQDRLPYLQREGAAAAPAPTLSGCVARGTEAGTYTLSTAKKDATTPPDADQPLTVALTGTDVDLAPHVGHTVTVTGSYAAAMEPTGATGTAGTEKPAPATGDAAKKLRAFTVKSLKMIAPSCADAAK